MQRYTKHAICICKSLSIGEVSGLMVVDHYCWKWCDHVYTWAQCSTLV